jgi:hypothetical protein
MKIFISHPISQPELWHVGPNGVHVAYAYTEANARLIAAAPDLLAALKEAARCLPCQIDRNNLTTITGRVYAAIAKAEGSK